MNIGEETAQTVISVTSKATLITGDLILAAIRALNKSLKSYHYKTKKEDKLPSGKQSLKTLSQKGVELDSIPVSNADIKEMTKTLKKFGIDFAVLQNNKTKNFNLFFKGQDTEAITVALRQVVGEEKTDPEKEEEKEEKADSEKVEEKQKEEKTDPEKEGEEKQPLKDQIEAAQKQAQAKNESIAAEKELQKEKQMSRNRDRELAH